MHVKTNDIVVVTTGREAGKTGRVMRVDRRRGRVFLEGLNIVRRHQRPNALNPEGGIIEKEAPMDASNVLLYSEQLGRGVRVSQRFVGQGGEYHATQKAALESFGDKAPDQGSGKPGKLRIKKVRMCLKTGEVFD